MNCFHIDWLFQGLNLVNIIVENLELDPFLAIPIFIHDFLCIHPFNDGNGRMSRLLTTLLLYRNGFYLGKYISLEAKINRPQGSLLWCTAELPICRALGDGRIHAIREVSSGDNSLCLQGLWGQYGDYVGKTSCQGDDTKGGSAGYLGTLFVLEHQLHRRRIPRVGQGRSNPETWSGKEHPLRQIDLTFLCRRVSIRHYE